MDVRVGMIEEVNGYSDGSHQDAGDSVADVVVDEPELAAAVELCSEAVNGVVVGKA